MASVNLSKLYHVLHASQFDFLGKGEFHIRTIYSEVKNRYPDLCDDTYLCSMNGQVKSNQPAWKHTVRTVLNDLKRQEVGIFPKNGANGGYRGYWVILEGEMPDTSEEAIDAFFPDEIDPAVFFREGATRTVLVNAYERNVEARRLCVSHYGTNCYVCGFNFGNVFGGLGAGYIHVHHLRPLSEIAAEYQIDPINDLRPVCPNCHAMIHRYSTTMDIEELKAVVQKAVKG